MGFVGGDVAEVRDSLHKKGGNEEESKNCSD